MANNAEYTLPEADSRETNGNGRLAGTLLVNSHQFAKRSQWMD